jgi:hypothetical protein
LIGGLSFVVFPKGVIASDIVNIRKRGKILAHFSKRLYIRCAPCGLHHAEILAAGRVLLAAAHEEEAASVSCG